MRGEPPARPSSPPPQPQRTALDITESTFAFQDPWSLQDLTLGFVFPPCLAMPNQVCNSLILPNTHFLQRAFSESRLELLLPKDKASVAGGWGGAPGPGSNAQQGLVEGGRDLPSLAKENMGQLNSRFMCLPCSLSRPLSSDRCPKYPF